MARSFRKTVWLFGGLFLGAGLFGGANPAGAGPAGRVISMGPNITETVFALGLGDLLVGVTDFCVYPRQARSLPKVGGVFNPNLERIAALDPDLVILQGKYENTEAFCRTRGIKTLHVAMDSLASIYQGIVVLGRTLNALERARALNAAIRRDLEAVQHAAAPFARQKVFISLGRAMGTMAQVYSVGGTSFFSEIVTIAGGDNIFADVNRPYPEVSKESLLKRRPEVVLEIRPGQELDPAQRRRIASEWRDFLGGPEVSGPRVRVLTQDFLLVPGPRIAKAARVLARALHGEIEDVP